MLKVMKLSKPILVKGVQTTRLSSNLTIDSVSIPFWYEVDNKYGSFLECDASDGFVVGVFPYAVRNGINIEVDGMVSEKLLYNLNNYANEVTALLLSGRKITVSAAKVTNSHRKGLGVFTGFSAGIDSFCTVVDHRNASVGYRITHFLFNNIGSHGKNENSERLFNERYKRLEKQAAELGFEIIKVNSNLDSVLCMDFELTHTFRNASVALAMQAYCSKFLYSSAVHYTDVSFRQLESSAYLDPVLLPLLSTESIDCISSGSQHTRFGKTEIVSTFMQSQKSLDVCVVPTDSNFINCSRCWKCLRTELSLDILGKLQYYDRVFSLPDFYTLRDLYVGVVLSSNEPLMKEIATQIKNRDYPISTLSYIIAHLPNKFTNFLMNEATWYPGASKRQLAFILMKRTVKYLVGPTKYNPPRW